MKKKIIMAGEPMGLLIANENGPLDEVSSFSFATAGAEFNVAVGLSRLGHEVGYLTNLGNDPFAKHITAAMKKDGISTEFISFSKENPTGFMLKGKADKGDPDIFYFRRHSAASTINRSDVDKINFKEYGILHVTGILPALSKSTMDAVLYLVQKSKENKITIFFDPNLRPQLWPDYDEMITAINFLAGQSDYFLPGVKEGEVLMGSRSPEKIAAHYLSKGVKNVIVKTGKDGAYAANANESFRCPTYQEDKIVDTVGAGDGFATGILSAVNEGLSLQEAVLRANAIGTIQIQSVGDNDGLPTRDELSIFMNTHVLKYQEALYEPDH
jgi:2-dehydro-3-deoxygluconokinase